jgi:hypothetical protein
MPQIGETKRAHELGFHTYCTYIYVRCRTCGEERWCRRRSTELVQYTGCCKKCAYVAKTIRKAEANGYIWCKDVHHPNIGEVISTDILGLKARMLMHRAICPGCERERWTQKRWINNPCIHCKQRLHGSKLRREKNPNWKGGRIEGKNGYIKVIVNKDHPFYSMAHKEYIWEHRLIMAQHINRALEKWEIVHHLNGIKNDNRIENLKLLPSAADHVPMTLLQSRLGTAENKIQILESRVTILEAENQLLKIQLNNQEVLL